ncbi:MAG: hypothetical protein CME07_07015, partial [Gemmatimonadetes bacterium]|nr:hypothetical protein [Gemmatimonadota bacterium]
PQRPRSARPCLLFSRPSPRPPPRVLPSPHCLLPALLLFLLLFPSSASSQTNEDCLDCHDDPELTTERAGQEVLLHVEPGDYSTSIHGDMDCVDCHESLFDVELPHEEEVEPVECSTCHDDEAEAHAASLHGKAAARGDEFAPECRDCHGTHNVLPDTDPASPTSTLNIPLTCGKCHHEGSSVSITHDIPQDRILENYSLSIHGRGLFEKGLTVTAVCTSCHTAHDILPHTDPASSIHADRVAETCLACHSRIEEVHRKVIDGELWREAPGRIPACVDCHAPHKIRTVRYPQGMSTADCLTCHASPRLASDADGAAAPLVDEHVYLASSHGGLGCAQCHTGVSTSSERACETETEPVHCAICHAEEVDQYSTSTHGMLRAAGDPDAPSCMDCHDPHATLDRRNPASNTFPKNVPELCARCHRAGEDAAVRIDSEISDIVESYSMSIHGKGLFESGLLVTATCTGCHTAHGVLPPDDPGSTIHRDRVAETCGSCHHGIRETFRNSIHSPLGNPEANTADLPSCEDCHSSHTITRTDNDDFRLRMMDQCGRCHEDEAHTFFDTFHGKVSRLGAAGAAKCYDCHGTHGILPVEHVESSLSRTNIVGTCGQCHEGSHRRFAGYLTHATHHDPEKYPYLFWAFWAMTGLLVGTLTFAILHTLAWLFRLWRTRSEWQPVKRATGEKFYRRFTKRQRTMHLFMILSFFTLSATGMSLKFSYASWAQNFAAALGGFAVTGFLHRVGAVVLFAVFAVHLFEVAKDRRKSGKGWGSYITGPDSMLFNRTDLLELIESVKWFLGRGPRPDYGRFTYWEKFDYFAVFWGVAIIGMTGLALWFPEFFTRFIPGWSINVATIIHSDEALLAVGFIFTVHFFNTHFRPDKFPMDPVIFHGRVPLSEFKHDKPREYRERAESGTLDDHLVGPVPPWTERIFRGFGFLFLAIGLLIIGLIVATMVFQYR